MSGRGTGRVVVPDPAQRPRQLTARGVKAMLSGSGVDHADLTIVEDPAVWTDLETGHQHTSVVITGPPDARRAARDALGDRGLRVAPYSDRDEWSR